MMMAVPQWSPKLSVGNDVLDKQHEKLLSICAQAAELAEHDGKDEEAKFHAVLNELFTYSSEHFKQEEEMLRKVGYPKLDEQIAEHDQYKFLLTDYLVRAIEGDVDKMGLYELVLKWWYEHVTKFDMAYKDYLGSH